MTTPPLPEPFDWCYEWDGPYGTRKFSAAQHNGMKPTRTVQLFNADQMHAYAAACVAAAQVPMMTDEQLTTAVLADRTLRYHFALNGGAGPVSEKGIKVFRAVEIAIRGTT